MNIENLIAATYTPLKEDGSLNLKIIKDYGIFLKSNNIAGAFVNGSTGDFASLTPDERKLIIDSWAKDKPSNFNLIKERIRNFKGCSFLELYRDKNQPNIFFTYSYWDTEADLENYRNSTLFKEVWANTKSFFNDKPEAWSVDKVVSLN